MKMKSLASLGLASILAASAFYAVPAMADDAAVNVAGLDQIASASTDSGMDQSDSSAPSTGSDATAPASGTSDNGSSNSNDNSNANSSDQGSPDTATGDDDY